MSADSETLNERTRGIWNQNAAFWDGYIGPEGNDFHRLLVAPAQMRLLDLRPGERVLEVACGNGQFAREMARAGVSVLATDFAEEFVEKARAHTEAAGVDHVEYRVADATDETQLLALGEGAFDAVVCTMALMDIADIAPLARALPRLLRIGGRFVFSITHPCFNTNGIRMSVEMEDRDGQVIEVYSVRVVEYLRPNVQRGIGIIGQPQPHYFFHRPLHELLGVFFAAGMTLDGMEEPSFPEDARRPERPWSWANYPQIPPVLAVRMRPADRV